MHVANQPNDVLAINKRNSWDYWNLISENGRQRWIFEAPKALTTAMSASMSNDFIFDKNVNPNSGDRVLRYVRRKSSADKNIGIPLDSALKFPSSLSRAASESAEKCIRMLDTLQETDGHWAGDYGGPMFLLPGLIFASYITESPFREEQKVLMKRYMLNHQNGDGGWGLHIEGESTMFGTVLQYCALRILGSGQDEPQLKKGRAWILDNGGAVNTPSWGKVFLTLLGVYEWEGCNSLMPEMWLLPEWLPVHPGNYWCHSRMVYLPMSYCFGNKIQGRNSSLIKTLKKEIFTEDYETINWATHRNSVSASDVFKPTGFFLKTLLKTINVYEIKPSKAIREKALQFALDYIDAEDRQTNYIDIGPVNQIINSICVWYAHGRDSEQFHGHLDRRDDYLWLAEDGMKMNGYNGSQLWDTAFAVQAVLENEQREYSEEMLSLAYTFIDNAQITEETEQREKFFRHESVGGWPFSTNDHGWPISDCTAEGLKAVLKLHRQYIFGNNEEMISDLRLQWAVDLILSWQNEDGGWATYENSRSGSWVEFLNPSEIFGNIMIDYSYVECSSACITALVEFQKDYPEYRNEEIEQTITKGVAFILKKQTIEGGWIGSWGICMTYGTWFGIEALTAAERYVETTGAVKNACTYLVSHQNEDGGWGESYKSCIEGNYIEHEHSQVVNTAWALLSLMAARYADKKVIDKGIAFLLDRQQTDGEWPQESISGVFNKTCMITYSSYRNIFPIWALGRYTAVYSRDLRSSSAANNRNSVRNKNTYLNIYSTDKFNLTNR